MVGSELSRYAVDRQYLIWDTETEGLNLAFHRPWELSYAVATLKDGIRFIKTVYIRFPDLVVSPEAARVTRFSRERYEALARPPEEVWEQFSPLLYSPDHHPAGHNVLGFDTYMVSTLRRALGMQPDHSWTQRVLDTNALSKAYLKTWAPDRSSPDALTSFQYRALSYRERGLKSNLGYMAKHLGIPYDEKQAHGAEYDTQINWEVLKGLIWKMEI